MLFSLEEASYNGGDPCEPLFTSDKGVLRVFSAVDEDHALLLELHFWLGD